MKHTKGEWGLYPITGDFIIHNEGLRIASIPLINDNLEEQEANAKLIAAAPELLEACNKATFEIRNLENFSENERLNDAMDVLVQAIKKATE